MGHIVESDLQQGQALLQIVWSRTGEIATELHHLAHRLHPSKLETLGLLGAVASHCRELSQHGLHVTFEHDDERASVSGDVALCVFRVVQDHFRTS